MIISDFKGGGESAALVARRRYEGSEEAKIENVVVIGPGQEAGPDAAECFRILQHSSSPVSERREKP